jgi:hypothetical protein
VVDRRHPLALLVGEHYVNRFNLSGRSYEVIPQVPRADRLTPETLTRYYDNSAAGQPVPLPNLVTLKTAIGGGKAVIGSNVKIAAAGALPDVPLGRDPGRHGDCRSRTAPQSVRYRADPANCEFRARYQTRYGCTRISPKS